MRSPLLPALLSLGLAGCGFPSPSTSVRPEIPAAPANIPALPAPRAGAGGPPDWAKGECSVPQVPDGLARFTEAAPWSGRPLQDALLLCMVVLTVDDFWSKPDPGAQLRLGEADSGTARASDTFEAILSWPRISLPVGGKLGLSVQDIDVQQNDFAGMDLEIFEGRLPLDLRGDHFNASCRALDALAVEALVPAQREIALVALSELQAALVPQPRAADWGFPHDADSNGRRALKDVAGYVGWEDSRVQGLLSQYDALQARWSQQAAASVRQERSAAPRQADIAEGLQAAVKGVSCEGRCVVTLLLDSAAARELWLSGNSEVWAFFAVLSDGRDVSLEAEGERSYLPLPAAQSTCGWWRMFTSGSTWPSPATWSCCGSARWMGSSTCWRLSKPMGITQYRLAKDISVPQRRISEVVQGKRSYCGYGPSARSLLSDGSPVLVEPPSAVRLTLGPACARLPP